MQSGARSDLLGWAPGFSDRLFIQFVWRGPSLDVLWHSAQLMLSDGPPFLWMDAGSEAASSELQLDGLS